jgi:hypothetical protein
VALALRFAAGVNMSDFFLVEREMALRVQEALQKAETRRLVRRSRLGRRRGSQPPVCWLLWQMGRLLVAMGQWLQQHGRPATIPLNEQVNGGMLSQSEQAFREEKHELVRSQ